MKAIYTLFMFVFCISIFHAQNPFECMTKSNDTNHIELKSNPFCSDNNYLPNYNLDKNGAMLYDQTGIYTIRLKVHVLQYSSTDPRNYTISDIPEILNAINGVNSIYSTIQSPSIPIVSPTFEETDTRIRFKLNPSDIEFVIDSTNYIGLKDSIHPINSTILEIIDNKTIIILGQHTGLLTSANNSAQNIIISGSNNNDGWYRFETANVVFENNTMVYKTEIKLVDPLPHISDLTGTVNYSSYNYMYPNYHYIHNATDNSAIHIYFQKLGTQYYNNGFGATKGLNSNFLSMVNPQGQNGSIGYELLAHKLGHCLGLEHTFDITPTSIYISDIYKPDVDRCLQ